MSALVPGTNETNLVKVISSLREVAAGRSNSNNGGATFSLSSGSTTTTVTAQNCGIASTVLLSPVTAAAAAAFATTFVSTSDTLNGSFKVTHASTNTAGRTFRFTCIG